jgi:NitT/TauT family transport system substrate-binding protein
MKRSAFTAAALTTAGGLMLASGSPAAAAADSVKLGVAAVYPTYSIFFATKELGFYKDANLDVDIETFRGGPASLEALAAGAVDLCTILPTAAALAITKGVKEKIVAMYVPVRAAGWYIMVPADSPIKTMADLNGKMVGVTQIGSLTDFWVQRVAKDANVNVTSVPLGGGVEQGLRSKKVDAAIMWPLGSYKGIGHGDLRAIVNLQTALGPTISEGVAASDDIISKRPDVLRRWLAATSKGLIYMQQHESWTITFLKKYFDDQDDKAVALVYSNFLKSIDPSGSMHADWQKTSLQLAAPSVVASLPPADQVFSSAFTPIKAH